jgi:hypothetical protein
MKPRKVEVITVSWSRLGRRLSREFNSRRLADQFVEELTSVARESAAFGSRITIESRTEVLVDAVNSIMEARPGVAMQGAVRQGAAWRDIAMQGKARN